MSKPKYTDPEWRDVPVTLSTQQVADLLGISINTVKDLKDRGQLPAFKVGRVLKFNKRDVMRFAGVPVSSPQ